MTHTYAHTRCRVPAHPYRVVIAAVGAGQTRPISFRSVAADAAGYLDVRQFSTGMSREGEGARKEFCYISTSALSSFRRKVAGERGGAHPSPTGGAPAE